MHFHAAAEIIVLDRAEEDDAALSRIGSPEIALSACHCGRLSVAMRV